MRAVVFATTVLVAVISAVLPSSAHADTVEDFARAWVKGETFDLDRQVKVGCEIEWRDGCLRTESLKLDLPGLGCGQQHM